MKKLLTLALALLMVFAVAAPAMAFTTDTTVKVASDWKLTAELIEYSVDPGDYFNVLQVNTDVQAANRGYAKNEIVAVLATILVPAGCDLEDIYGDGTNTVYTPHVYGEGITFKTVASEPVLGSNNITGTFANVGQYLNFTYNAVDNCLDSTIGNGFFATNPTKDTTVKFIVFAKVTDDEGYITIALEDLANMGLLKDGPINVKVAGYDWTVTDVAITGGRQYQVVANTSGTTYTAGEYAGLTGFYVNTNTAYLGKTIVLANGGNNYLVQFDTFGNMIFLQGVAADGTGATNVTRISQDTQGAGAITYKMLVAFYNEIVKAFGLDATLTGYARNPHFEALQSAATLTATVEIEPYTAYVTVPDNIVTTPPKTGAAVAISGFVMMAASLAAVAMKKK